jgi:hypothetical protein
MMIYVYWKDRQPKYLFFITWATIMLILTIASRRYDYYLAACVALLTAYAVYRVGSYLMTTQYRKIQVVFLGVVLIAIPLLRTGIVVAHSDYGTMPVEWRETTAFLDETVSEGTVLTHRDYGYWIMSECALTVITSPSGNMDSEQLSAQILLESNQQVFTQMLDRYTIKYIVIDNSMFTDRLYPMLVMSDKIQAGDTMNVDMVNNSMMSELYRGNVAEGIKQIFESSNGKAKAYEYTKNSNR